MWVNYQQVCKKVNGCLWTYIGDLNFKNKLIDIGCRNGLHWIWKSCYGRFSPVKTGRLRILDDMRG